MKIDAASLQNYTPATHTKQSFPAGENWYKENVDSLASGKSGWRKIDLSPTLNLEELQKSADEPPGWKYLAIKQNGKITIVSKNATGKLEIAKGSDGFEPMSGPAHLPEIRAQLASGRATAWQREVASAAQKSTDELDNEIESLRKDVDVLDKDITAYQAAAKSPRRFLNSQIDTLSAIRKELASRIERLEVLRDAARAREKPAPEEIAPPTSAAQRAVSTCEVAAKTPAASAVPLQKHEPDIFPVPDFKAEREKEVKSYLDSASDLLLSHDLRTTKGQAEYKLARESLKEIYASLALHKPGASLSSPVTADLKYVEAELKELDAIALTNSNATT
jgi:outer membrane murein-binding lipoprotein Lpp